jgi:hypothetical protein
VKGLTLPLTRNSSHPARDQQEVGGQWMAVLV